MNYKNGYQHSPSESFADISITGLGNFCKKIAYLLLARTEHDKSYEKASSTQELIMQIRNKQRIIEFYKDSAKAIEKGMSIETLRALNETNIQKAILDYNFTSNPHIPTVLFIDGKNTGEPYFAG